MQTQRRASARAGDNSVSNTSPAKASSLAPKTIELDKNTFNQIVKNEHQAGYILIDTSKCTGKETYNRMKAHLTAIDGFCIFDGKEALDSVRDKTFSNYARKMRRQLKTAQVVALYDLDSFTKDECKLARAQLCKELTDFLPSEICPGGKGKTKKSARLATPKKAVICLTRLPAKKIIKAFNIQSPQLLHSYKVTPSSPLAKHLRETQLVKLNGAVRERVESAVFQRPRNAETKEDLIEDILRIMETSGEIIRSAQKTLPNKPVQKFDSMRKHGDPVTFLKVHYSPWLGEQGILTQKALQQIDRGLFTSLIGKTRRTDSAVSMAQIFPPAPRAHYRKRQAGRSPRG